MAKRLADVDAVAKRVADAVTKSLTESESDAVVKSLADAVDRRRRGWQMQVQ